MGSSSPSVNNSISFTTQYSFYSYNLDADLSVVILFFCIIARKCSLPCVDLFYVLESNALAGPNNGFLLVFILSKFLLSPYGVTITFNLFFHAILAELRA